MRGGDCRRRARATSATGSGVAESLRLAAREDDRLRRVGPVRAPGRSPRSGSPPRIVSGSSMLRPSTNTPSASRRAPPSRRRPVGATPSRARPRLRRVPHPPRSHLFHAVESVGVCDQVPRRPPRPRLRAVRGRTPVPRACRPCSANASPRSAIRFPRRPPRRSRACRSRGASGARSPRSRAFRTWKW